MCDELRGGVGRDGGLSLLGNGKREWRELVKPGHNK